MRKNTLVLAVLFSVASVGIASGQAMQGGQNNPGTDTANREQTVPGQNNPQDSRTGLLGGSDANDIRWTVARIADNALMKGGWDNLVMRLVDADRNRIGQFNLTDEQQRKLDGRVDQLQKAFKEKYGDDFNARGNRDYLSSALVQEGEFGRDAQLAAEVKRNSQSAKQHNNPGSGNVTGDRQNVPSEGRTQNQNNENLTGRQQDRAGNDAGDQNLEEGRNIAVVTLPGIKDKPELRIPMIHELPDSWKINAPDALTGQQLYDNLLKHLTKIGEKTDEWPATADEAYRAITYSVVAAILDESSSNKEGSNPNLERKPDGMQRDNLQNNPGGGMGNR